jgi:hypothetical protein
MAIYIVNSPPYLDPSECNDTYASSLTYERDAEVIFWTAHTNSEQFRVLWQDLEVGRCDIASGSCELRVP